MAYQVVLYDEDDVIVDVLPSLEKVEVEGNSVLWAGGGLVEVKSSFLVLDESVSIGDIGSVLESSLKNLDQKKNLKSEILRLQAEIQANQEAINFLLGL
jgi:hypothetical protein